MFQFHVGRINESGILPSNRGQRNCVGSFAAGAFRWSVFWPEEPLSLAQPNGPYAYILSNRHATSARLALPDVDRRFCAAKFTGMRISLLSSGLVVFLLPSVPLAGESVTATRVGKQVVFRAGKREMFRYQTEPGEFPRPDIKEAFRRGGYIHPILTPSGRLVTDDFPTNHVHHHGLWLPWTKTEFEGRNPDFWNMGEGKGRVEFVALDKVWQKDGAAGLTARHQFVDLLAPQPKTALLETWEVTATSVEGERPHFIIDLTSTQTCASDSPLKLPKYYYGGLGFRGNGAWNGETECEFLTSSGERDRVKGNESRGQWCWIGGTVNGRTAGVTILCHPENYRFPQPMRLHPKEPFFCFAPQQVGDMEIVPGKPYISRYRFIIADDKPETGDAQKWWLAYAGK
jgi:Family of unknown function (DUF6807)